MSNQVSCEIVIPCFRESLRLPSFLESLAAEIEKQGIPARVTVVDDGSGAEEVEKTLRAISPSLERHPVSIAPPLLFPENRGKGGAVYSAWRKVAESGA